MPLFLFLLFVALPALEIYLLVQFAHAVGFGWILLYLVSAAFVGLFVMRRAGAAWWRALRVRTGAAPVSLCLQQRGRLDDGEQAPAQRLPG